MTTQMTPEQTLRIPQIAVEKKLNKEGMTILEQSGLLADLFEAAGGEEIGSVDRDKFRSMIGLPPINPPLLRPIGTVEVPAVEGFVASEVLSSENFWTSDTFKKNFFGLPEENSEAITLRYQELSRGSRDEGIRKELGPDHAITLGQFVGYLAGADKNRWHVAYILDVNGVLWTVYADWDEGYSEWNLNAYSVESPNEWSAGDVIVSR